MGLMQRTVRCCGVPCLVCRAVLWRAVLFVPHCKQLPFSSRYSGPHTSKRGLPKGIHEVGGLKVPVHRRVSVHEQGDAGGGLCPGGSVQWVVAVGPGG